MRRVPPIDMHSHIEVDIAASDLQDLGALVFAATRTLDDAELALKRSDAWTVWGVGCHPGLVAAQKAFDTDRFTELVATTPYVGEVGLDGKSRVPMDRQLATFNAVLMALQRSPRLTSIHSFAAIDKVLQCLTENPVKGAVLHWWLGSQQETERAIELGCYFSVNASALRNMDKLAGLPLNRVLPETDHPFGDKASGRDRRPGKVENIEQALASIHGVQAAEMRKNMWRNLAQLIRETKCGALLPRAVRTTVVAVG